MMMARTIAFFALLAFVNVAWAALTCKKQIDLVLVAEDSADLPDAAYLNILAKSAAAKTIFATDPPETLIKNFLARIENHMDLSTGDQPPDNQPPRVAFQTYGQDPQTSTTIFNLKNFTITTDAKSAILTAKFTKKGSQPSIGKALDYTLNNVLTVNNGERSCAPAVVVLLSYSSKPDPNGGLGATVDPDVSVAKKLRNLGALVVVVGVGPKRDPALLIKIASDGYYNDVSDFTGLTDDLADTIANKICDYVPTNPMYPYDMDSIVADIVFVVDTSTNMFAASSNAKLIDGVIGFAQNFLAPLNFDKKDGVQVALVTYSKTDDEPIKLGKFNSFTSFITEFKRILALPATGTERNLFKALDGTLRQVLTPGYGMRANVAHTVFVFAADCFTGEDPAPVADAIRKVPADLYLITLGSSVTAFDANAGSNAVYSSKIKFWKEALDVVKDPAKLFDVPAAESQSILSTFLPKVAWNLVEADSAQYTTPAPPTTTPAVTTSGGSTTTGAPTTTGPTTTTGAPTTTSPETTTLPTTTKPPPEDS